MNELDTMVGTGGAGCLETADSMETLNPEETDSGIVSANSGLRFGEYAKDTVGFCSTAAGYECNKNKSMVAIMLMLLVSLSMNPLQLDSSKTFRDPFIQTSPSIAYMREIAVERLLTNDTYRLCPKQFRLDQDTRVSICSDPTRNNTTIVDIRKFRGDNATIIGIGIDAESVFTLYDIMEYILVKVFV